MARRTADSGQVPAENNYYTFVAGLNTDASPLSPAENASVDEENFVLDVDGSRRRRLGLALETGGNYVTQSGTLYSGTPTVLAPGSPHYAAADRMFSITLASGAVLNIEWDDGVDTLWVWWNRSSYGKTPFQEIAITGATGTPFNTTNRNSTDTWSTGGAYPQTYDAWIWTGVSSFPALAATPAVSVTGAVSPDTGFTRAHPWRNVAGASNTNYTVVQQGSSLWVYTDLQIVSTLNPVWAIDLYEFRSKGSTATRVDLAASPVTTSYGRGHFFVSGRYIDPFWIEYVAGGATSEEKFVVHPITLQERDFEGIDDNVALDVQPLTSTPEHLYNLTNRGWMNKDVQTYYTSRTKYPAKNMIPWLGYRGLITSGIAEEDWTKEFSPTKMVNELFQDVSAPVGHIVREVFDNRVVSGVASGLSLRVTDISPASFSGIRAASTETITITTEEAHGLIAGNTVYISDWSALWTFPGFRTGSGIDNNVFSSLLRRVNLSDKYTVIAAPTTTTYTISVNIPELVKGTTRFYLEQGSSPFASSSAQLLVVPTTLTSTTARPGVCAFYAGRVWYSGIPDSEYNHKIYFSQIVESTTQYGKCYSIADPTSKNISDPLPQDGGYISIPEMELCVAMMQWGTALLVFASNGVWMISGAEGQAFLPTSYNIRRITSVGCVSGSSVGLAESIPVFWGDGAIYAIEQDSNSGYMTARDISTGRIQKYYTSLDRSTKSYAQFSYDRALKRVYWLYNEVEPTGYSYDKWLIWDLRLGGVFTKHEFKADPAIYAIKTLFAIHDYSTVTSTRNIKFIVYNVVNGRIYFSELNNTSFQDFGVDAAAYLDTGYGNEQDSARRKYGHYVTTFVGRTQTGWTDVGTGEYTRTNPGGCLLSARWNWTDADSSGKWMPSQQIYKEREIIPASITDVPPYKVLVAKNKVRGSGRAMQLRFATEAGKDCHILGWNVNKLINVDV